MKQSGFFDVEERLAHLRGLGDQLEAFSRNVDFEIFRPDLDQALTACRVWHFEAHNAEGNPAYAA